MTLTAVVANYQKKVTVTKLKKASSVLSNAMQKYESENGSFCQVPLALDGSKVDAIEFVRDYMNVFDASVSWANWSDDPKIRELALNKDTFELSSARHIPIYKCNTLEELNEFKTTFSGTFTMDGTRDEVPSFEEVTADYTEDFFIENTLLLVYVEANSCTPRFGVDSVSKENGTLSVHVKYTYTPEEGDSAMAGWLFTIPVNNDQIQDCTNFDAVLK